MSVAIVPLPIPLTEASTYPYTLQPYPWFLLESSATEEWNYLGLLSDHGAVVFIALLPYWVNQSDDERILRRFEPVSQYFTIILQLAERLLSSSA
ncbi:hypothetical protein F5Y12DRAFT_85017 [Xylaria sp. FL1777]|nr:hypothetical protein F5Y12DRAFT_85017 [Xylaria sp. FL1777]